MRTAFTSTVLALLVATKHVDAFAPVPFAQVKTRAASTPRILPQKMVMDKKDPLGIMASEQETKADSKKSMNPTPFFVSLFQDNTAKMKMTAAAMALALIFLSPLPSDAAMSGGRMGGSFSSSPRSSMSRSYSGGSSSYSGGYSRGYSRPSVIVTPGFGYNPFFPGYGYGAPGIISYSRGPSFFSLLLIGGFMFAVANAFRGAGSAVSSSSTMDLFDSVDSVLGPGTSVVQMSVALDVPNRDDPNSILSVMDRLAATAKTDSRVGIQNLTSQVALELLRRRSSIVSASSDYKHFRDSTKAGREFQSRSVRERSKFEKETVSKYGGVDYSNSKSNAQATTDKATMAVVTLVLAIDGDSTKTPRINSISDVEEALRKIASDSKVADCLQSAEILWTPEDRSETVSLREIVADYPELRSV